MLDTKYYINFKNIDYEGLNENIDYIDDATKAIKQILKKNNKTEEDINKLTYYFNYIIILGQDGYEGLFNNIKIIK